MTTSSLFPPTSSTAAPSTSSTGSTSNSSNSSSTSSSSALNKLSSDFNSFLTLLTTQLQNQDPLSPMDSTQFTAQLVAFTGVEQQIETNTKLTSLIGVDQATQLTSAATFIGDSVQAPSNQVNVNADGTASEIGYTLPSTASSVTLTITDSSGNVVSSGSAPTSSGANIVTFTPENMNTGDQLPAGAYTVSIQALDQTGAPMSNITTSIIGTVTNVSSSTSGGTQLSIGAVTVPLSTVTSVQKPSSASNNSTSSSS
jgi:flagellar basal-body rod modification protein FlgD